MQFYKLRRLHWHSVDIKFDALPGYRLSWDASLFQSRCLVYLLDFTPKHSLIDSFPILNLSPSRTPFLSPTFALTQHAFCYGSGGLSLVCLLRDLSAIPDQFMWDLWSSQRQRGRHLSVEATLGFPYQYVSFHWCSILVFHSSIADAINY